MKSKTIVAIVHEGTRIPFDGTITDGLATVDESAETGVSTPALLDASEGRNRAIAGTLVVNGWLKIESPIDARMYKPGPDPVTTGGVKVKAGRFAFVAKLVLLLFLASAIGVYLLS